ncbi:MAG: ABC transporter permease [Lachnospiraceae bacterium]|nr:ABC transporter permease [Lachnospiraceae bacterium]MDD3796047.1 ABC transporter permease [Lachnospiraceae bacterium]
MSTGESIEEKIKEIKEAVLPETESGQTRHAGRLGQIKIYLGKLFRIFIYEKDWKVLPMAAVIAVMVAYVVGPNMFVNMEGTRIGSLALVCVCIWNGFFNSIQVVCRERAIIKREHRSGLHISSYIAAHMIYQALVCICQIIISLAVYWFAGMTFPTEGLVTGSFLADIFITLFLITYASDMMALMVSCIVHTTTSAMTVMPFLLIVQLVFAGVAFPLKGFPARMSDLTVSKWGIYAVCTEANYNNLPSTVLLKEIEMFDEYPVVQVFLDNVNKADLEMLGAKYLQNENYEYEVNNIIKEWKILLAFALLYVAVGVLFLEFIDHDKR